MGKIPLKLRRMIDADSFYGTCALFGQHGHECEGRITMEHSLIFQGKQVQKLFAIVPLCAHGHGVDRFQDDASTSKELRVWVSLNRATDDELRAISKVPPGYIHERNRLNKKYGVYEQKVPTPAQLIEHGADVRDTDFYPLSNNDKDRVNKIRQFNFEMGTMITPNQAVQMCIEDLYLSIKSNAFEKRKDLYDRIGFEKCP